MIRRAMLAALFLLIGNLARAEGQATVDARGQVLYSTYCGACHSERMHWREKKLVTNWTNLRSEVRRWQEFLGLGWKDDDIEAVVTYLNQLYYHFPSA